jgi:hypothetical protein
VSSHVNEHESGLSYAQAEAVEILMTLRRRLANRMAVAVVTNKQQLLGRAAFLNSPLDCNTELAEISAGLGKVDQALAAMTPTSGGAGDRIALETPDVHVSDNQPGRTFDCFVSLVEGNRLEEASRELSRILQMPLDRAGTATHFLARTTAAEADLSGGLARLQEQIISGSAADSMRLLMRTFGFQAVESRMAMEALRSTRLCHVVGQRGR